jgi:hypothetical protein
MQYFANGTPLKAKSRRSALTNGLPPFISFLAPLTAPTHRANPPVGQASGKNLGWIHASSRHDSFSAFLSKNKCDLHVATERRSLCGFCAGTAAYVVQTRATCSPKTSEVDWVILV